MRKLSVLHLVAGDLSGGAAKGAYNLHNALLAQSYPSAIISSAREIPHNAKHCDTMISSQAKRYLNALQIRLDSIPTRFYRHRLKRIFSNNFLGYDIFSHPFYEKADIIHLHWINAAFLSLSTLSRIKKPIVWTLRDMWAFSGGCHYALGEGFCEGFKEHCGRCPSLHSRFKYDLSYLNISRKKRLFPKSMRLVGLSSFISDCAAQSAVFRGFRIDTIPNCIDTDEFAPLDKTLAKSLLRLHTHKPIILCGANHIDDFYKGFPLFVESLRYLNKDKYFLVFFGNADSRALQSLGFECEIFGYQSSAIVLRLLYSAASVFVAPSVLEAFGKTIVESMACGTPVVAFDNSSPKDIITHKSNGYLARGLQARDLARGIKWILSLDSASYEALSHNARKSVIERFSAHTVAQQYIALYSELLESNGGGDIIP